MVIKALGVRRQTHGLGKCFCGFCLYILMRWTFDFCSSILHESLLLCVRLTTRCSFNYWVIGEVQSSFTEEETTPTNREKKHRPRDI